MDAAQSIRDFERMIGLARAAAYEAGAALHRAASHAGVSPVSSRRVFAALTASQSGLDAALVNCAEAHRRAVRIADELGLDPVSYGGQTWEEELDQQHRRG